jgi:hypothetical protein
MKKPYQKPTLVRRELLPQISAQQNGSVVSPIVIIIDDA